MSNLVINVPYVSVWDGGIAIETTANVHVKTGEVTDIKKYDGDVEGLDICEEQYIIMNDERVYVYEDEPGFDYWADINGELEN